MNGLGVTEVTPEFLDVRGRRTQLLRRGSGPAVVYLHSASAETYWTDFDAALVEAGFEVLHPAHPGFDGSEGLAEIDDIADLTFHTLDLLDAAGVGRASLIGSSLGGWLAAEVAVVAPERVERLVLVDAVGLAPPAADLWALRPPELADLLFADHDHWMAQLLRAIDVTASLPPPEILMPLLQAMEAAARVGWNPMLHNPKLAGRLHRVGAPALVVWGERDGLVPREHAERYAELIPNARLETIPGCGHLPALECPAALARLCVDFLRG